MLSKKRAYKLSTTLLTFLLGAASQFLITLWLPSNDVIPLTLLIIVCSLVLILIVSLDSLNALESVIDLASRSGIRVEYIEDDRTGRSYRRSNELIKNAKKCIIIVSPWEPFSEYKGDEVFAKLNSQRHDYYNELTRQIDGHTHDVLFHKRILQTGRELEGKPLQFKTDPIFFNYLKHTAEIQQKHPRACHLRRAPTQMRIHFTIIDERYVIIPIFSSIESERLIRHGVLIFDDRQGDLVKSLNEIYETLDAQSKPIEIEHLIPPNEKKQEQ